MDEMERRTQQERRVYRWRGQSSPACVVRGTACVVRWSGGLPLSSATHFYCFHGNTTRAPIANPPSSKQLRGIPYHSAKLHPGSCNSVGMRPRTDTQTHRQTDRHTHTHTHTHTETRVTTIHFASSTIHVKCNNINPRSVTQLNSTSFNGRMCKTSLWSLSLYLYNTTMYKKASIL